MLLLALNACKVGTIVKNYPQDQPFVFESKVEVKDKSISKETRSSLETGLYQQLDDSLKNMKLDRLFWSVLKKPPRLDSSVIGKSVQFMHYYLNAQGYFRDSMNFTTTIKPTADQLRTYINFGAWPGPVTRIDSLWYNLRHDTLQQLANENLKDAVIKSGDAFAQGPVSTELDRLVELFRNNGYIKFSRDMLFGFWDTLDVSLLQPALDPIQQAELYEKLRQRNLKPTANLEIRLRPVTDSSRLSKYYVGQIYVLPDNNVDTLAGKPTQTTLKNITISQSGNKFKPKIFPPNIYLKHGNMYRQRDYLRTINRFNQIGAWRLVEMQQMPRTESDTVDFVLRMLPAKKYAFTTSAEGNFSQSSVVSSNFFGLGFNIGIQNRNFMRGANLASTNLRYGVEIGEFKAGSIIQTQQLSMANSISYPRFIFPGLNGFRNNFRGTIRSIFNLNGSNTERRELFNLTSFNTNWGYEFSWRSKTYSSNSRSYTLGIKLPNIEYSYLIKRDSLDKLIAANPSIRNYFQDGLISSVIANFVMPWATNNNKVVHVFRLNMEQSGLVTSLIRNSFIDSQLYRFIKLDMEYARLIKWSKTSLVLRGFGGIGYEFDFTTNPNKRSKLPFFKQYYSGGPNSMRAWQLRRLGPGSSMKPFKDSILAVPDRFGDVQLEANIEYRMPLFKVAGIPFNGAVFTDVGNVWMLKKSAGDPDEVFKIGRLGTDLAIGSGVGVRADLGFFVIRVDAAYKVKDPSPDPRFASYRNRFFAYPLFKGSQLQLGISYPFIF